MQLTAVFKTAGYQALADFGVHKLVTAVFSATCSSLFKHTSLGDVPAMRLAPQMEDDRLLIVPADRRRIELEHVASCGALQRGVERNSPYQLVQIDGQLPATIKRLITHPKMATSGKT